MRRAGAVSVAACSAWVAARVVEEQIPFEVIDRRLGIDRSYEERAFWSSTHASGAAQPLQVADVRSDNVAMSRTCAAGALAEVSDSALGGFRISSAPSLLQDAGDGAHLSGSAPRGSVVAFYHGIVYGPIIGRFKLACSGSEYALAMVDSYLIDGLTTGSGSSLGPLINHPPPGTGPNVMFYPVCCDADALPASSAAALHRISWYDSPPLTFDGRRHVRTTLIVALRDLEDEELLVDYVRTRQHTRAPIPAVPPHGPTNRGPARCDTAHSATTRARQPPSGTIRWRAKAKLANANGTRRAPLLTTLTEPTDKVRSTGKWHATRRMHGRWMRHALSRHRTFGNGKRSKSRSSGAPFVWAAGRGTSGGCTCTPLRSHLTPYS
eukprot:5837638-Prymnesium_polylepis.1